jgi:two-component system LytT family response regulator/two-component system response regulator AlgR
MSAQGLRVVVAEDEVLSQKRLVRLLQEAGCQVVATFPEGRSLHEWLRVPRDIDAIFLDIHMPNMDGLELLKAIQGRIPVVLTTAFSEHAVEAFDTEASDYLLKPITASRLGRALNRIQSRRPAPAAQARPVEAPPVLHRYPVQAGTGVVLVDLAKTTHFEVENEVVWAHAGTRLRTNWTSLAEVESAFTGAGLLRVHRHLLLRPEAVIGLKPAPGGRALIRLQGGQEIEASRGGAPRLRERLGI